MRKKGLVFTFVFTVMLSLGIAIGYKAYQSYSKARERRILLEKRKAAWSRLRVILENKVMDFNGQLGVVIKDLGMNWEIDFNKNALFPAASLVKVPILLSYFYAAQEGRVDLNETIRLKASEKVQGSKILGDLPAGSLLSVKELFNPMITISDNTATNILIDLLGIETLNSYFAKLGLHNTNLARKMMAFEERLEGRENYTTAEDMAYLLEELYNKSFLNKDTSQRCLELLKQQKINDRIPQKLPRTALVAHKTGLERYICHDVGIVFTDKGNFLICVLAKHKNRFAAPTKKIISDIALLTYNYYQNLN